MSSDLERFLQFFEGQRLRQAPRFPTVQAGQVLAFMGTTSTPGTFAQVSIHRLRGLDPGPGPHEVRLRLAGPLPLRPRLDELLTVHLTRLERYQGYQVKTRPLAAGQEAGLFEEEGDLLTVRGRQVFTVHHSPYTLKFFEQVPWEDVAELAGGVRHALCAVGPTANLSPRFVFHHEVKDGQLSLFHGDGLALKTWLNLKRNRQETRLVLDLDEYRGWALRGTVEEVTRASHPVGWEKVMDGFAAGRWGRPGRCFRLVVDTLEPIEAIG